MFSGHVSPERDDRSLLTYAAELRSRVSQGTDAASMQNNCASKANLTMRLNRSGAVTLLYSLAKLANKYTPAC